MNVNFDSAEYFDVGFTQGVTFDVEFGLVAPIDTYRGPYIVIPSAERQTLPTIGKLLEADVAIEAVPTYEGEYEVTPKAHTEQTLDTQGKMMTENLTVFKVPYYETSNIFDGKTVFIAEDTNG